MDDTTNYIQGTSEYIGTVKPHFKKLNSKLGKIVDVVLNMDSPKQTKASTKKELIDELDEAYKELGTIVDKTGELGQYISDLAQGDQDGKGKN